MNKLFFIILICLILLTGCNSKDNEEIREEKVLTELEYFSSKFISMSNSLNDISLENYEIVSKKVSPESNSENGSSNKSSSNSDSSSGQEENKESSINVTEMKYNSVLDANQDDIDWDSMKEDIENINTSWGVVIIDLYTANIPESDIKAFEEDLNKTIIGIKEEDKSATILNVCKLYSYIPEFIKNTKEDDIKTDIEYTKYHILSAYTAASLNNWDTSEISLQNAENSFINVVKRSNNENKTRKTYMIIKDLQNAIGAKDKELFFLKYKNLMENINNI